MAKQEELKSFQELITAEKQKAKPKNSLRYGRKIGESEREALEKPRKEASLAYANTDAARPAPADAPKPSREKPRQKAAEPAARPKKQAQKSGALKETPVVKKKSVPPQKASASVDDTGKHFLSSGRHERASSAQAPQQKGRSAFAQHDCACGHCRFSGLSVYPRG